MAASLTGWLGRAGWWAESRWQHRGPVAPPAPRSLGGAGRVPPPRTHACCGLGPRPLLSRASSHLRSATWQCRLGHVPARSGLAGLSSPARAAGCCLPPLGLRLCAGTAARVSGRMRHLSRFRVAKALGPKTQRAQAPLCPWAGDSGLELLLPRGPRVSRSGTVPHTGPARGSSKADDPGDRQQVRPPTQGCLQRRGGAAPPPAPPGRVTGPLPLSVAVSPSPHLLSLHCR